MFAFHSNMSKNYIHIMAPFGLCQYSRWILKSLSIFDDSTTIQSIPNLNLIPKKKKLGKMNNKIGKKSKAMEANDFANFKVNVDKSPVDVWKRNGHSCQKKTIQFLCATKFISDGKMKKIQTTIHRLFTNTHTQHDCSKIKWIEIIYTIYDAFKSQFDDTNSVIPGTF